jgi:hypothetical protein
MHTDAQQNLLQLFTTCVEVHVMSPESSEQKFLWINKNRNSTKFAGCQGNEARSAHIFVQKGAQSLHRSSRAVYDSIAFQIEKKQPLSTQAHSRAAAKKAATTNRAHNLSLPNNNVTPGSACDPFMVSILPAVDAVHTLMQYSRHCILIGSGGHKTEAFEPHLRPFKDMYHAAADLTMSYIVRYEHVLYPMMAAFAQRSRCRQQYPFTNLYDPVQYLQTALVSVRRALTETSSLGRHADVEFMKSIATGINFLIFAAGLAGRLVESQLHIQALLRLSHCFDYSTLTDCWLMDTAATFDILYSAYSRKPPALKSVSLTMVTIPDCRRLQLLQWAFALRHDPVRKANTMKSVMSHETKKVSREVFMKFDLMLFPEEDLDVDLGESFSEALMSGQIHPQIRPVLREILECLDIARVIWHRPDSISKTDSSWLCYRAKATLHRLLFVAASNDFDDGTLRGRYAECLVVTLTIILEGACHRMLHITTERHVHRLRSTLQSLLDDEESTTSSSEVTLKDSAEHLRKMLLWIFIMGFWAGQYTSSAGWFSNQAVISARRLGLESHDDIHKVMKGYLYSKTVQYECIAQVANQLLP